VLAAIEEHNTAWREWFASASVRPHLVQYEELDAEPARIARGVLGFLGLDLPAGREIVVRHKRLADKLNAQWIDAYRLQELQRRSNPEPLLWRGCLGHAAPAT
jgi:trehalose 2-sulfotransferase